MKRRKWKGIYPTKLVEAMLLALDALGENGEEIKVQAVAYWIECRWPNRWAYVSITSYFSMMSRPQVFRREKRGYYKSIITKRKSMAS
jgi:hypothetical protein